MLIYSTSTGRIFVCEKFRLNCTSSLTAHTISAALWFNQNETVFASYDTNKNYKFWHLNNFTMIRQFTLLNICPFAFWSYDNVLNCYDGTSGFKISPFDFSNAPVTTFSTTFGSTMICVYPFQPLSSGTLFMSYVSNKFSVYNPAN